MSGPPTGQSRIEFLIFNYRHHREFGSEALNQRPKRSLQNKSYSQAVRIARGDALNCYFRSLQNFAFRIGAPTNISPRGVPRLRLSFAAAVLFIWKSTNSNPRTCLLSLLRPSLLPILNTRLNEFLRVDFFKSMPGGIDSGRKCSFHLTETKR